MAFSFGFSGDDIDAPREDPDEPPTPAAGRGGNTAFPVPGKPQLPPTRHDLAGLLAQLPSKIAYGCLDVALDGGAATTRIPRRELWDVRLQLMAEDDGGDQGHGQGHDDAEGLGEHDVKTGVYEGGFKSWESSVDLVKVLAAESHPASLHGRPVRVIELGCGTALPSLALFQWAMALEPSQPQPFAFILADYNPSVLRLVTMPNFLLAWALHHQHQHPALRDAFSLEGELELGPGVLRAFQTYLLERNISLSFLSGGWSPKFVQLLYDPSGAAPQASGSAPVSLLLGAETIYSPFALQAFNETVFAVLGREQAALGAQAAAFVAAKRLYFGVGGSLDDFIEKAQAKGGNVTKLRQETEGVARGVVRCVIQSQS
ncbi:Histidine protein methyltransferase 1 [Tolypocladium ophioglossoides CBS 100239]|uniref:protein-histidine N-methyltransferase n=1 Tax=Tolypocladium ophioglossoides (strain CBS 100239) TaxID=1163406 RepID=A0A0L0N8G1_TOLOC|nr:Histidine protein methyltransferase 1 [Tolypocladium ophioglossoides CBS 100239]